MPIWVDPHYCKYPSRQGSVGNKSYKAIKNKFDNIKIKYYIKYEKKNLVKSSTGSSRGL